MFTVMKPDPVPPVSVVPDRHAPPPARVRVHIPIQPLRFPDTTIAPVDLPVAVAIAPAHHVPVAPVGPAHVTRPVPVPPVSAPSHAMLTIIEVGTVVRHARAWGMAPIQNRRPVPPPTPNVTRIVRWPVLTRLSPRTPPHGR